MRSVPWRDTPSSGGAEPTVGAMRAGTDGSPFPEIAHVAFALEPLLHSMDKLDSLPSNPIKGDVAASGSTSEPVDVGS